MKVFDWTHPSEIKELMCGNKTFTTQCQSMGCLDYICWTFWSEPAPPLDP